MPNIGYLPMASGVTRATACCKYSTSKAQHLLASRIGTIDCQMTKELATMTVSLLICCIRSIDTRVVLGGNVLSKAFVIRTCIRVIRSQDLGGQVTHVFWNFALSKTVVWKRPSRYYQHQLFRKALCLLCWEMKSRSE